MQADDAAARAAQRDLVRRGYDEVSFAYRDDDGQPTACSAEHVGRYAGWVAELAALLPAGATVADLGCGAGIPATRELTGHGLRVLGVDFSAVQLARARRLVPAASLVRADITALRLRPASLDGVVSFYSLIHVPLADQRACSPESGPGSALTATCWRSPGRCRGPGPSPTSAPRCSGTTRAPTPTCAGSRRRGSRPSGTGISRKGTPGTASSWPAPHSPLAGGHESNPYAGDHVAAVAPRAGRGRP